MTKLTPMMKQYLEIKDNYKDCILFFRLGDFYEMFFDDAIRASEILGITLTSRNKNQEEQVPLCGVPYHSATGYISKLLSRGIKVAICEQIEDPKFAKGIVERSVIRVITPGLKTIDEDIVATKNNYLLSLVQFDGVYGISFLDFSTGDFHFCEFKELNPALLEISRISPAEIIIPESYRNNPAIDSSLAGYIKTYVPTDYFDYDNSCKNINQNFVGAQLCSKYSAKAGFMAAGAILSYTKFTQKVELKHLNTLSSLDVTSFMGIDEVSRTNLELVESIRDRKKEGTLFATLNQTKTPMGARLLRNFLLYPLYDLNRITQRQNYVEEFYKDLSIRENVRKILSLVGDIERVCGKISVKTITPRDFISLKNSITQIPRVKDIMENSDSDVLKKIIVNLDSLSDVANLISQAIVDEPPAVLKDGGFIKSQYSKELFELVDIITNGKEWIAKFEVEEKKRSGMTFLKVKYNRIFGYYIEVTKSNLPMVPSYYIRKQTLVGAERFVTPELKEFEEKILTAFEKRIKLEEELFEDLRQKLLNYLSRIKRSAEIIGEIDVFSSLAGCAQENNYVRPEITLDNKLVINSGRHPVLEHLMKRGDFIPNDVQMDADGEQIILITGPNMAGKSTVMRQVALIVIMAQVGSFVPAASAQIGLVDKIFTRVGAMDNITAGQSTFMVEMSETANILRNATKKSLILMDEIGRGTSTFDGISIAWAVCEYIHDKIGARTLFATHYHELTDITEIKERVKNYNVAVKEWNDEIIFVRKLLKGATSRSYGIQVARLAGINENVVNRAKEVLVNLEKNELNDVGKPKLAGTTDSQNGQLTFFDNQEHKELINEILEIDINELTPLEALKKLDEIKKKIKK